MNAKERMGEKRLSNPPKTPNDVSKCRYCGSECSVFVIECPNQYCYSNKRSWELLDAD